MKGQAANTYPGHPRGVLSSWQPLAGWRGSFPQSLCFARSTQKGFSIGEGLGRLLQQTALKRAKRRWHKREVKEGDHS